MLYFCFFVRLIMISFVFLRRYVWYAWTLNMVTWPLSFAFSCWLGSSRLLCLHMYVCVCVCLYECVQHLLLIRHVAGTNILQSNLSDRRQADSSQLGLEEGEEGYGWQLKRKLMIRNCGKSHASMWAPFCLKCASVPTKWVRERQR